MNSSKFFQNKTEKEYIETLEPEAEKQLQSSLMLSELVKIHRLEANSDWGFAAFTLKEAFSYKGEQNNDLSTYSLIFKKIDCTWKISWMQRSSGNTDLSTWD